MKTGSFKTYVGPGRISIARYARGTAAGFRIYSKLAPGPWFKTATKEEYTRLFFAQLHALDPKRVVEEIEALAAGHEPILMCHEVPPFTESNWCHRRMVAEWLGDKLGLDVPELEIGGISPRPIKDKTPKMTPQQVLSFGTCTLEAERSDGGWEDVVSKDSPTPLVFANAKFAAAAIPKLPELVGGRYAGRTIRVKP